MEKNLACIFKPLSSTAFKEERDTFLSIKLSKLTYKSPEATILYSYLQGFSTGVEICYFPPILNHSKEAQLSWT